ncbi:ubiquitin-related domain-containing protein [Artemisia annua]|uniref:Ubiquitin-related domain-containing protein n=1 Tax=Artemisia annua TaxID=35608 RepID=A0A2U1MNU9_ARTAN|nr:ubiquitin-related domain-containing protein [Artemisia annua]
MMMKLKSKRFSRSFSRLRSASGKGSSDGDGSAKETTTRMDMGMGEVKWEMRPGGMLVQRREIGGASVAEGVITVRVTNVSHWHDISIQPTSTFGELKKMLSKVTSLDVKEQRLLFKGKERDDEEHLHMVGVRDNDKVLLLQDPAIKAKKLLGLAKPPIYRTISV